MAVMILAKRRRRDDGDDAARCYSASVFLAVYVITKASEGLLANMGTFL